MYRTAKLRIGIVLLVFLVPLIAYAQDLSSDLHSAAKRGDITAVNALLAKGAEVNAKDKDGRTALMYAAGNGHTETVETLLAKGAEVNAEDKGGRTALMYATWKGHTKIVRLLKQAGARE